MIWLQSHCHCQRCLNLSDQLELDFYYFDFDLNVGRIHVKFDAVAADDDDRENWRPCRSGVAAV